MSVLQAFHPAVSAWFERTFDEPSPPQLEAWPAIRERRHTLISAPTGSGKTLAAFLASIDDLVHRSLEDELPDEVHVVYVSPLKALSNDIRLNLDEPLRGIDDELRASGHASSGIRASVRTGDTPQSERAAMKRRPPHILVTTPESLYILLTSEGGRRMLRTARSVIVDEIHAVVGNKRGSHLSLTLERLDQLVRDHGGSLVRIGLSATQRPLEEVARFLVGAGDVERCRIVDAGHRRKLDLALELPGSPLEAVAAAEVWTEIYDRLAQRVREHEATLIFVNTRRLAERVARQLSERLGEEQVTSHHGSLSREQRLCAERRLKDKQLRALVATASLELGIDVGHVDLVCTIGSTRAISTLLQRVGRSGHFLRGTPKGRLFPTSRDDLVECAALLDAVQRGELERLAIPRCPLDILSQQIVAAVACDEWQTDDLYELVRRALPFHDLPREDFDAVVEMLASGISTRRGRRGALVHHDAIHGRLRPRRGARLAAITSGGAIPDNADYRVVLQPAGIFVGTVDEDFAIESLAGDVFQLGNSSWRIQRIEHGRVLVEDAHGEPPNMPFWFGEAPGRSDELSQAVCRLRADVSRHLDRSVDAAVRELAAVPGVGQAAAEQIVQYLHAAKAALGMLPDRTTLVLERFFDEAGNQHVVIHSPFGVRLNRAWGLALRKRFCRSFNFELQAAATDDAIVLSLGPTHSFPLAETFEFLRAASVRDLLVQALLDAPMFGVRWRWNAGRSLALLRWRGGRKVPPRLQRMEAEDLIAVVFPDQLACLENIAGEREIPDHPLVRQTVRDCLEEAMDVERLESLLREIEAGRIECVARELREPSPLAHEIVNAKPYAFLDDAPLEERRTQAVQTRRWLDPATAADLGRLDVEAIEGVREEAWPDPRDADELHDALVTGGFLTRAEGRAGASGRGWDGWFDELVGEGRATTLRHGDAELWIAAERLPQFRAALAGATMAPELRLPDGLDRRTWESSEALSEILRGRLEVVGPISVDELARSLGLEPPRITATLSALEGEGFAMQGRFTPGLTEAEWCERRLLARIHRRTLRRLRREIEPVSQLDFMRFLLAWQRADPSSRAEGAESVAAIVDQLEGYEAPAAAWEGEILPARLKQYDPLWLDALCLAGRIRWGRVTPSDGEGARPIRTSPLALLPRGAFARWRPTPVQAVHALGMAGRKTFDMLAGSGASFFDEIVQATGLLRTQVEEGLSELVARGAATADSFTGLRALLTPSDKRPPIGGGRRRSVAAFGMDNAGRWSLLEPETAAKEGVGRAECAAHTLLRRYGVVCRRLLDREGLAPPWRELLPVYRRLEARGEIRGGRFVDGFSGEHFALIEAVGRLRAVRREEPSGEAFSISAADPLNLVGIVVPGDRVAALTGNRILFRDGLPLAVHEGGEVRLLVEMNATEQWAARNALLRRRVPPALRAYLGRPA